MGNDTTEIDDNHKEIHFNQDGVSVAATSIGNDDTTINLGVGSGFRPETYLRSLGDDNRIDAGIISGSSGNVLQGNSMNNITDNAPGLNGLKTTSWGAGIRGTTNFDIGDRQINVDGFTIADFNGEVTSYLRGSTDFEIGDWDASAGAGVGATIGDQAGGRFDVGGALSNTFGEASGDGLPESRVTAGAQHTFGVGDMPDLSAVYAEIDTKYLSIEDGQVSGLYQQFNFRAADFGEGFETSIGANLLLGIRAAGMERFRAGPMVEQNLTTGETTAGMAVRAAW